MRRQPRFDTPTPTTPTTPKLKHPVFAELAEFTIDQYWLQIFQDCSRNKFPRNSGFDKNTNSVWFRNLATKELEWVKLTGEPKRDFQELKSAFQTVLRLRSKRDRSQNRKEYEALKRELDQCFDGSFKSIKKKNIRECLVRNFIMKTKVDYELTEEETISLTKKIKMGFLFGWIKGHQVVYEDRQIVSIDNLIWEPKTRTFEVTLPKKLEQRKYTPKQELLSELWEKRVDPNWNYWISPENVAYVQSEIARRLRQKYREYIEVPEDRVKSMLIHTHDTWRGPLNLNELLEMTICDFVKDIDTDIEWQNRFNHFEPRTLYFPGTDLTREEKVKLNPGYKFEFQMNY